MSNVELSIQLQTDSIAAVKAVMNEATAGRPDNTFWWLADYSHDITYQNRVSGSELLAIDQKINNSDISSVFGGWFGMQNTYFTNDRPIPGVSTLKQAIETYYRWRVAGYFNDVMQGVSSQGIVPQYVFPNTDFVLGNYQVKSATTGSFTHGPATLDPTSIGPGILALRAADLIQNADVGMTITAFCQDQITQVSVPAVMPKNSAAGTLVVLGGQKLTSLYAASSGTGVVEIGSTSLFRPGQWVLLREDLTAAPTYYYWKTEVAQVVSIVSNVSLTLGQSVPIGSVTPVVPGLRNDFSSSAFIYPLFIDVTAVAFGTGTTGDSVDVVFNPDRPQGFIDITPISYPQ